MMMVMVMMVMVMMVMVMMVMVNDRKIERTRTRRTRRSMFISLRVRVEELIIPICSTYKSPVRQKRIPKSPPSGELQPRQRAKRQMNQNGAEQVHCNLNLLLDACVLRLVSASQQRVQ
jgi:hypothetical protein